MSLDAYPALTIILAVLTPAISGVCTLIVLRVRSEVSDAKLELLRALALHESECNKTFVRREDLEDVRKRLLRVEGIKA